MNKKNLMTVCLPFVFLVLFSVVSSRCRAGDEVLCFEAESSTALEAPVQLKSEKKENVVSGGKYLEVPQGAGDGKKIGGKAKYSIELKQGGTYYFWIRAWWIDSCGNSFGVIFDDKPPFTCGQDGTYKKWHWVKSKLRLKLKAGKHDLVLTNREDGARVDQILLTNDKSFVPVDIEEVTK